MTAFSYGNSIGFERMRTEVICDQVQRMCIVLHLNVEACEIETIEDVVFFYLTEIFVSFVR
jgi:hypothetical protein